MAQKKHKNNKPTFEQIRHFGNEGKSKNGTNQPKRAFPNTTKGLSGKNRRNGR